MNHTKAGYRVFSGEAFQGNIAQVIETNSLPQCSEEISHSSDKTLVYIQPMDTHHYGIAWFQKGHAIQRCGHGTLAAAMHLFHHYEKSHVVFHSQTETLKTNIVGADTYQNRSENKAKNDYAELELTVTELIANSIRYPFTTRSQYRSKIVPGYQLVILTDKDAIDDFYLTSEIKHCIGNDALIISAQDKHKSDLIYFRYFAPAYGSDEDPATGSAADILWAYWQAKGHSTQLHFQQRSSEGGLMSISFTDGAIRLKGSVKKELDVL